MFLRRAFLDYLRYTGCIQSQQSIKIGHLEGPQNLRGPVFYHIFVCTCLKIGFGSTTKKIYQFSWFRPQTVCVCMWGRWGARGLASTGVYYPQPGSNQVSMCRLALKGILPWAVACTIITEPNSVRSRYNDAQPRVRFTQVSWIMLALHVCYQGHWSGHRHMQLY